MEWLLCLFFYMVALSLIMFFPIVRHACTCHKFRIQGLFVWSMIWQDASLHLRWSESSWDPFWDLERNGNCPAPNLGLYGGWERASNFVFWREYQVLHKKCVVLHCRTATRAEIYVAKWCNDMTHLSFEIPSLCTIHFWVMRSLFWMIS